MTGAMTTPTTPAATAVQTLVLAPVPAAPHRRAAQFALLVGVATALVAALSVPLGLGLFDEAVASSVVLFGQFAPLAASLLTWWVFGRRERLRDLWALRVPSRRGLFSGLGRALVALVAVAALQAVVHVLLSLATRRDLDFASSQLPLAAAVLPLALALCLPCFGEEVAWRGHLWRLLDETSAWRRVLVSSLVWALWHGPLMIGYVASGVMQTHMAVVAVVNVFFAGLLLGWLRETSGTVWPAVFGHALLNSAMVYLTGLMTPPSEQATWPQWHLVVFTAAGAVGWFLVADFLARRRGRG